MRSVRKRFSGKPACRKIASMARAQPGTLEACFNIPALPAMSAGAANRKTCQNGKFQGMTASTTPNGWKVTNLLRHQRCVCTGLLSEQLGSPFHQPCPFSIARLPPAEEGCVGFLYTALSLCLRHLWVGFDRCARGGIDCLNRHTASLQYVLLIDKQRFLFQRLDDGDYWL